MSATKDQIVLVKEIFSAHLEANNLRRTSERYVILEEIYNRDDHFDAEALYVHMKVQNYRVSRATVYNTLDLLVNCNLVKKHQFGKNLALYERAYAYKQHDHAICQNCQKVIEFCDPRIQQIKDMVASLLDFEVQSHNLNMYGLCSACRSAKEAESN